MKQKIRNIIYASILLILISSGSALGASVTVCSSGCDYTTISNALSANGNGAHTVTVQSPYTANENIAVTQSGADEARPLTIKVRSGDAIHVSRFVLAGSYLVVDGFIINGAIGGYDAAVQTPGSYITVQNCQITPAGSNVQGVNYKTASGGTPNPLPDNITIKNSTIANFDHIGISGYYTNSLIEGNTIRDNRNGADAIWMGGHSITIRNNTFMRINELGATHTDIIQTAGNVYAESYDIIFEGNYVASSDAQLCNLSKDNNNNMHSWTFRNNVVSGVKYACNIAIPYTAVYNNTFYRCNWGNASHPLFWMGTGGILEGTYGVCKNNMFIDCGGPANGWYGVASVGTFSADYNYVSGAAPSFTWKKNFNESNGINGGNPKFVNIMTGNFKLQAGSPAINKGTTINAFNYDKDRVPRPQGPAWDIGASEYNESSMSAPTNFRKLGQ